MTVDSTAKTDSPRSPFLVFSDLDATLLDDQYRWDAAAEAIAMLRSLDFPIVLSSSKTLDEMKVIAAELKTEAPLICENGGIVAIPSSTGLMPYTIEVNGHDRETILDVAHGLRASQGYRFEGFDDWTTQDICEATGLAPDQAERAMNRRATEPILWKDDEEHWSSFEQQLKEEGIHAIRGGRFIHLIGNIDKVHGVNRVVEHYQNQRPGVDWTLVSLGDSPNDLAMLSRADVAIVIPNPRHPSALMPEAPTVVRAGEPGPAGWNRAIIGLLEPFLVNRGKT